MNQADFASVFCERPQNFAWFLGAGASRTAGLPAATDTLWDIGRRYNSSIGEFPPGAIGGAIGAAVGGALGFLSVQIHCEMGVNCPVARSVLTGAAIEAIMGLFVEWVVRSGPKPV